MNIPHKKKILYYLLPFFFMYFSVVIRFHLKTIIGQKIILILGQKKMQ